MDDTTIKKWDDCKFQNHVSYNIDLFALDNNVCGIVVNASKSEFTDGQGNEKSLTLAPIVYEKLYLNLREDLPELWCRGNEAACVADDTRALFNHVTPLQLTKSKLGTLSDEKIREILKPSAASPVFLGEGESIAIITNCDPVVPDNWRGFYIDDPHAPKIWTMAQLRDAAKEVSVMYSEIHSALPPMPEPQQGCRWLRDGTQENTLEIPEPTSRTGPKGDAKPSGTAIAKVFPSSEPNLEGGGAPSKAAGPTGRPGAEASNAPPIRTHTPALGSVPSSQAKSNEAHDVPAPTYSRLSELRPTERPGMADAATAAPSLSQSSGVLPSFTLAWEEPYPSGFDDRKVLPRK